MSASNVFLSYRDEDAALVEPLRQTLAAARTVVDHRSTAQLAQAINEAELFVGCISARGYAADELQLALGKLQAFERDKLWLLIVRLEACAVPAMTITATATLGDFEVSRDGIAQRFAAGAPSGRSAVIKAGKIYAKRGTVTGTQSESGDVSAQDAHIDIDEMTIDNTLDITGHKTMKSS